MFHHVRARTHYAHVAYQHVDELRQLVDVRLAHDVPPLGLSWVVTGCLQGVCLGIHFHAAELQAVKIFAVQPGSFLPEEYRTGHGQLGDDAYHNKYRDKQRAEESQ